MSAGTNSSGNWPHAGRFARWANSGWITHLSYAVLGAVVALGLPPVALIWLAAPALGLVLLLEMHASSKSLWRPFMHGFLFGFGYFCVALHWIGFAFLVDKDAYLWMMPFAVGGLACLMAAYWGLAFWLAEIFVRRKFARWIVLACAIALMEMLRGILFTGFPWAAPGLMVDASLPVLQIASLIGMPGLTLLVLLWGFAPAALWMKHRNAFDIMLPLLVFALLPLAFFWGQHRLNTVTTTAEMRPLVRLVQPNISQSDKWRDENANAIFDTLLTLTAQPSPQRPDIIIWPESAVPFLLDESEEALQRIARTLEPGQTLLTGAIRRDANGRFYTSILVINDAGKMQDHYDKWRLVPGGEFLPMAWLLEPLGFRKVVSLPESFTAGSGPRNLDVPPAGKAAMLICYEAIFPFGLLPASERPAWIVNVTNDGWFGTSVGPWQHLAQVRLRAVEQGLPVARAANTGVSAVIDGHGVLLGQGALGQELTLDRILPLPLPQTSFARYGATASLGMILVLIAIGGYPLLLKRQES